MRIVGGKFGGQTIASVSGQSTRPTSERVREAIFNILVHGTASVTLEGARVLDLFAGTGAFGFEALSRGAKFCQFVDDRMEARATIRRNADALGVIGQCKIWRRDATRLGPFTAQTPFDLVFIDPPYETAKGDAALCSLIDGGWLKRNATAVLEESARAQVELPAGMERIDERLYGDTKVLFLRATGQVASSDDG
jgi:16S rRNA (guanine966-N2)-methyltransferase